MIHHEAAGFWDEHAGDYDENNSPDKFRTNTFVGEVIRDIGCDPDSLLDLGAGTGLTTAEVMRCAELSRIVGVDLSAGMLEKFSDKYPDDPRFSFVQTSVEDYLRDTEERFDMATFVSGFTFGAEPITVMNGIARVLRPRGRFIFTYDPIIESDPERSQPLNVAEVDGHELHTYRYAAGYILGALMQSGLHVDSWHLLDRPKLANPNTRAYLVVASRPPET